MTSKRWRRWCLIIGLLLLAACGDDAPVATAPAATLPVTAVATTAPTAQVTIEAAPPPSGRLIYLRRRLEGVAVVAFDVAARAPAVLYQADPQAWLTDAALRPGSEDLVLAYAPPPPAREPQLGFAGLYHLAPGQTDPVLLYDFALGVITYRQPFFSPDGSYLYFLEVGLVADAPAGAVNRLLRQAWPAGDPEVVATDVTWPSLAPTGDRVVFIRPEADGAETRLSLLELADGAVTSVPMGAFDLTIDAPLIDPTGDWIYFTAVSERSAERPWLDRLLGTGIAAAHTAPADWWRVPVTGGTPEKVADVGRVSMSGAFAPIGAYFAYSSGDGLYLMKPDGSAVETLVPSAPLFGTLAWVE